MSFATKQAIDGVVDMNAVVTMDDDTKKDRWFMPRVEFSNGSNICPLFKTSQYKANLRLIGLKGGGAVPLLGI